MSSLALLLLGFDLRPCFSHASLTVGSTPWHLYSEPCLGVLALGHGSHSLEPPS